MSVIKIDNALCDRSPACPAKRACAKGAIVPIPGGNFPGANGYTVVEEKCSGCGACVRACHGGAIQLT